MKVSDERQQTMIKYAKEHLKRIPLDVQKEEYEEIKEHVQKRGETMNGFIKRAIRSQIERDNSIETKTESESRMSKKELLLEQGIKQGFENWKRQFEREKPLRDKLFEQFLGLDVSMRNVVKTSDMVSVVRCKDCKHRVMHNNYGNDNNLVTKAHCELDTDDIFNFGRRAETDDWFCADGEYMS